MASSQLIPHNSQTKVKLIGSFPRVLISRIAHDKMWHYIDIADQEVSWLGTVVEQENDFLIEDVFLLEQGVSSANTDITEEGQEKLCQELLAQEDGVELWNKIRFWGHSHVNGGTSPSGTDEQQMKKFAKLDLPFWIRGIFNKKGRAEFSIFFYSTDLAVTDVAWSLAELADKSLRAAIEKEFAEKVTQAVAPTTYFPHSSHPFYQRARRAHQAGPDVGPNGFEGLYYEDDECEVEESDDDDDAEVMPISKKQKKKQKRKWKQHRRGRGRERPESER